MALEPPELSGLSIDESASRPGVEASVPAQTIGERLDKEWYIRVKTDFRGASLLHLKGKVVTEAEERVVELHEGLKSKLNGHDVELLSQRLIDPSDEHNAKLYTCYWLIGLPAIPSAELGQSRKFLKVWQDEGANLQTPGMKRTLQAKFVPRKMILEQGLEEDFLELPATSVPVEAKEEKRRTGETFKKKAGSNPAQVRKQFLQHAMGGDQESAYPQNSIGKLRPPKDVLNRLKYDTGYNLDEYVVGYIDRQAGILEKPVGKWEEYEEQELIAYFKHVPKDLIIWDRARKVDWIFNARPG